MERPDGSTVNGIGVALIVVGVLAAFAASLTETIEGFWIALLIANLGIGLGVLLCSLGYLVRAIWFLPGREIDPDLGKVEREAATSHCSYCGLEIASPAQPCSAVTPEQLAAITDRIDDENCFRVLQDQGVLPMQEEG